VVEPDDHQPRDLDRRAAPVGATSDSIFRPQRSKTTRRLGWVRTWPTMVTLVRQRLAQVPRERGAVLLGVLKQLLRRGPRRIRRMVEIVVKGERQGSP
jgi:hypothetical protein